MPANKLHFKLYQIIAFWLIIAAFELLQNLLSSALYGTGFSWFDALAYKTFWFLFIPGSLLLLAAQRYPTWFTVLPRSVLAVSAIAVLALSHLLLFALLLYGLSALAYATPWPLHELLFEKLSSRLYIALGCYSVLIILLVYRQQPVAAQAATAKRDTLQVKQGSKTTLVPVSDIQWLQSDGPYLHLYTGSQKFVITCRLKQQLQQLPTEFLQIHRSVIVNSTQITQLHSRGNGDYDVQLKNHTLLRLSRHYAPQVKARLA